MNVKTVRTRFLDLVRSHSVVPAFAALSAAVAFTDSAQGAASSSSIVITHGTRAAEAFFNRTVPGTHANKAWIDLYDAKCDATPVYAWYSLNGGGRSNINNANGCGTTSGFNLQSGYFAIVYRACIKDGTIFRSDSCGLVTADHN
jgi:hypothetical protein